jgi:hypothetical protein
MSMYSNISVRHCVHVRVSNAYLGSKQQFNASSKQHTLLSIADL